MTFLKAPHWEWYIVWYFFLGGIAGGGSAGCDTCSAYFCPTRIASTRPTTAPRSRRVVATWARLKAVSKGTATAPAARMPR